MRRDHRRRSIIAVLEDLQQVATFGVLERRNEEVVEDEDLGPGELGEQHGVGAVGPRDRELVHQTGHPRAQGSVTAAARRLRERGAEERLSNAGRADRDDVLLGADPLARRQGAHDVLVEPPGGLAPHVFEAGVGAELGVLQPTCEPPVLAIRPFALDHQPELLLEGHPAAGRRREQLAYSIGHRVELEVT
ncbi:MAG TPA: hypothetical protein VKU41_27210 [Polyangiaceae bacterium]|nr:hypothetical protein [Polyangiaceae bacterium]